jgi:hypothetical protein
MHGDRVATTVHRFTLTYARRKPGAYSPSYFALSLVTSPKN